MNSKYTFVFWSLIGFCFIAATFFMFKRAFSPHKPLTHMLIEPSAKDSLDQVALSLKKILYPLYIERTGVLVEDTAFPTLKAELEKIFSTTPPLNFSIYIHRINLEENLDKPCPQEVQRLMIKKKKNWDKKYFFAACTTKEKTVEVILAVNED